MGWRITPKLCLHFLSFYQRENDTQRGERERQGDEEEEEEAEEEESGKKERRKRDGEGLES